MTNDRNGANNESMAPVFVVLGCPQFWMNRDCGLRSPATIVYFDLNSFHSIWFRTKTSQKRAHCQWRSLIVSMCNRQTVFIASTSSNWFNLSSISDSATVAVYSFRCLRLPSPPVLFFSFSIKVKDLRFVLFEPASLRWLLYQWCKRPRMRFQMCTNGEHM